MLFRGTNGFIGTLLFDQRLMQKNMQEEQNNPKYMAVSSISCSTDVVHPHSAVHSEESCSTSVRDYALHPAAATILPHSSGFAIYTEK